MFKLFYDEVLTYISVFLNKKAGQQEQSTSYSSNDCRQEQRILHANGFAVFLNVMLTKQLLYCIRYLE